MESVTKRDVGALNMLDEASVRAALALATQGKVYDLGVDLGNQTPRLPSIAAAGFMLSQYRSPVSYKADAAMRGNSFNVEVVYGSLHQSSHLDALIHAQRHGTVYGGGTVDDLLGDFGWRAFGAAGA